MTDLLNLTGPMNLWGVAERAMWRANDLPARDILRRIQNGQCSEPAERAVHALLDVMIEDSINCHAVLRSTLSDELANITNLVHKMSEVLPRLVDDPNAQIVSDMVMARRFDEARELITEIEGKLGKTVSDAG